MLEHDLPQLRPMGEGRNLERCDRGEIDLEHIPSAVLAMPFDLVRHDMLMDLKPLKPARTQSIVDELFLPLVQNHQAGRTPRASTISSVAVRAAARCPLERHLQLPVHQYRCSRSTSSGP
jgi:hypothetical protein